MAGLMLAGIWYAWPDDGKDDDNRALWWGPGPGDLFFTVTASDYSTISFSLSQSGNELESRLLDSDWTIPMVEIDQLPGGGLDPYRALAVERVAGMADRLFGRSLETNKLWDSPAIDELALAFAAHAVNSIRGGATPPATQSPPAGGPSGPVAMSEDDEEFNTPPEAYDDDFDMLHSTQLTEPPPGVLWNDFDTDGDPLTAILESGPSSDPGFSLSADGSFIYSPPAGWTGVDGFTYYVTDGMDDSDTATVLITVFNSAPQALDDSLYETLHDEPLVVPDAEGVLQNDYDPDYDPFWAELDTGPTSAASFSLSPEGGFTYTPSPNWSGPDSFTYYPTDGIDAGEIATVTIGVRNTAPDVSDDGPYSVATGGALILAPDGLLPPILPSAPYTVEWGSVRDNDYDQDGDQFSLTVETGPAYGTLTYFDADLNLDGEGDGGFIYTSTLGYVGSDYFIYYADDGVVDSDGNPAGRSDPATVSINVVLPEPDIDTDSDNNGFIERSQLEDDHEMLAPGKILFHNIDDDNANGIADRDEAPLLDAQGRPVMDDDLKPAVLSVESDGAGLNGFTLELVASANLRLWATGDKQPLAMSYTIGIDPIPETIYVEGYDLGQGTVDWILKSPAGEVNGDKVLFSVAWVDIVAYRPQTESYGAPFPRTAVPADKERQVGVGIRRNGDDDDGDGQADYLIPGPTANENDLIEVGLRMKPASLPGVEYRLERTNTNIKVWGTANKTSELFVDGAMEVVVPGGDPVTKWVEWVNMDSAANGAELRLWIADAVHDEKVVYSPTPFYPFESVVIAFGGNGGTPLTATHGSFVLAQQLYEEGYDVHAYDEEDVDAAQQPPYNEVKSAVEERGVDQVAIFGYSQGGGATFLLSAQLMQIPPSGPRALRFTAYMDAIIHDLATPERRRPMNSQYHVSYWQSHPTTAALLRGDSSFSANFDLDVRTTGWGASLDHLTMDNHDNVIDRIREGSDEGGSEGPHDGLIDRVSR